MRNREKPRKSWVSSTTPCGPFFLKRQTTDLNTSAAFRVPSVSLWSECFRPSVSDSYRLADLASLETVCESFSSLCKAFSSFAPPAQMHWALYSPLIEKTNIMAACHRDNGAVSQTKTHILLFFNLFCYLIGGEQLNDCQEVSRWQSCVVAQCRGSMQGY